MSLEGYRREKMIVLPARSTVYQAARAMADNHIGAVLVSESGQLTGIVTDRDLALAVIGGGLDPRATRLREVMTEALVTCPIEAELATVARLMRDAAVRRVPILEEGRLVGLITLDDLVLSGEIAAEDLRAIVSAQLEMEAPLKPAGATHPARATSGGPMRALMRARARAEATYDRLVTAMADATQLDRERAERGMRIVTCLLCRRVTPDEAGHLIAQLPSLLHAQLESCAEGPDRSVTVPALLHELGASLGLDPPAAERVAVAIVRVLAEHVSPGQVAEFKGQLPQDLRGLFPAAAPPAAA